LIETEGQNPPALNGVVRSYGRAAGSSTERGAEAKA